MESASVIGTDGPERVIKTSDLEDKKIKIT